MIFCVISDSHQNNKLNCQPNPIEMSNLSLFEAINNWSLICDDYEGNGLKYDIQLPDGLWVNVYIEDYEFEEDSDSDSESDSDSDTESDYSDTESDYSDTESEDSNLYLDDLIMTIYPIENQKKPIKKQSKSKKVSVLDFEHSLGEITLQKNSIVYDKKNKTIKYVIGVICDRIKDYCPKRKD